MTDHPISQRFDDIYFSLQDGLAETDHVFLKGNHLPERFAGQSRFTIAETGFGTGLNFLSVWTAFDRAAAPGAVLDYISFELYPLSAAEIENALSHWSLAFDGRLEQLVKHYPLRIPGWHRVDFSVAGRVRVRLTLIFDDVNLAMPRMVAPRGVDAWFLDGHAPAKNPQMWSEIVFTHMARLSAPGATLASFTAAGVAKDGLRRAGFDIQKTRGYGRKRDMIIGHYAAGGVTLPHTPPRRVAILGGGLAGTACAAALRLRGIDHVLFETAPGLATGASGNPAGLFNPRFSAERNRQSDFYAAAFAHAARVLRDHPSLNPCGSLHLVTDADKEKRFQACLNSWGWHEDHMRFLSASEAREVAGIDLDGAALYLPDSGQVSPHDLCHDWAGDSQCRFSTTFGPEHTGEFDAVIHASGAGVKNHDALSWLPLETVRGQMISVRETARSQSLKTNLCYGGYIGAATGGRHVVGSSFQKWLNHTEIRAEDTAEILDKLHALVPALDPAWAVQDVTGARAALRCAAQDRFPVIGALPDHPHTYISTAHGSHGIISALLGGNLVADLLDSSPLCLPQDSVTALSAQRFLDRIHKKQNKTSRPVSES